MPRIKAKTPDQVLDELRYHGMSIADWARDHGYKYKTVYEVISGDRQCLRGKSHDIAVALGMKNGIPRKRPKPAGR